MTIRTNHHAYDLISYYELTAKEARGFDYIEGEDRHSFRLFRYRGEVYDTYEFERIPTGPKNLPTFPNWDGYQSDTYFSGIVIRYVSDSDYEQVRVGTYFS